MYSIALYKILKVYEKEIGDRESLKLLDEVQNKINLEGLDNGE